MLRWNLWSLYWLLWLAVGFLAPELYALRTNDKNTLSYQVWHLEGTGDGWSFGRYFVLVFCVWLLGHFVMRWWH